MISAFRLWGKAEEALSYFRAMESYVYGFPLVMMGVTKDVLTATPTSGEYKAPINQFGRIRTYVNPDFKDVVRISVNSLWSHGFVDLEARADDRFRIPTPRTATSSCKR